MLIQQWSPIINRYCASEPTYTNAQSLFVLHSLLIDKNPSRCVTVLCLTFNVNNKILFFRLSHKQVQSLFHIETQQSFFNFQIET